MTNDCPHAFLMPDEETVFCRSRLIHIASGLRFVTPSQCRFCPRKVEDHQPGQILEPPPLDPSLLERLDNFREAVAAQFQNGFDVEEEVAELRKKVCEDCPTFSKSKRYCRDKRCGCKSTLLTRGMIDKWNWSSSSCPQAFWLVNMKSQSFEEYLATCKTPKTGQPFEV